MIINVIAPAVAAQDTGSELGRNGSRRKPLVEKQKLKKRALELLYKNSAGTFENIVDADIMGQHPPGVIILHDRPSSTKPRLLRRGNVDLSP